jgi:hypothetical protein
MAVAAYTYNQLTSEDRVMLPPAEQLMAALDAFTE